MVAAMQVVGPVSPKWLLIAMVVVFVIVAVAWSRRRRRVEQGRWDVKVCPHCGVSQPSHAAYCRGCGERV